MFCAKQNIPLRGHRHESGWSISGSENVHENPGNFLALLRFRADSGDAALACNFSGSRVVNYQSPRIQNEMLTCVGDWVRENILKEVREQLFFSICADEAADCSNKEQMPLVVRFVDQEDNIREEFIDFVLCDEGTTGRAIADKIILKLAEYRLDIANLRGQCYDGAGNMAGRMNGAAALIQREAGASNAHYFHCSSHALNLCIMATSKIQAVRSMWSVLREVSLFFNSSPKRQHCFEEVVCRTLPESNKKKLVDLCRTRWVARNDALSVFLKLYPAVVETLTIISSSRGWNADSASRARSFLNSITSFSFISTFIVTSMILAYTAPLATGLQKKTLDIVI